MSRHDDLPPAVVAAITALLATMQESDDEPDEKIWTRSGRVAPSWAERDKHGWRDDERERGWRA